jgi:hypothetical protein
MRKITMFVSASALACAVAGFAHAQCDVTPPPGAFQTTDGCGITPDTNGGCNASPNVFTNVGSVSTGSPITVVGEFGTYDTNGDPLNTESRDLDWLLVTTPTAGKLRLSLTARNYLNAQQAATVVFIKRNVDVANPCLGAFDVGIQSTACPHDRELFVGAGTHLIVVTVPFDTAGSVANQCGPYRLNIALDPLENAECGVSSDSCTTPHATGGCSNIGCCEQVCGFNPFCCLTGWDASCVDLAVDQCGLFLYNCQSPGGAPSNDCATNPRVITVGQTGVVVANANAGTDGPGPAVGLCGSPMGKDLWYRIQAPGNGALTVSMCASSTIGDSVMEIYRLGTDPVMTPTRAQNLPSLFIGCVDDTCGVTAGTEALTLIDAVEGEYYLIRIGGWYDSTTGSAANAATFSHNLETSFERVVYTTGPQIAVLNGATLTNLGLSSGCIAANSPQRWLAMPWTAPAFEGSPSWNITKITAKGFVPAGNTNETMNWIVWNRSGTARPVDGDQVASGFVTFPTGYDNPADDAANASHDIVTDFNIAPGDYYLTVYGANSNCPTLLSNFAWFVSAPAGIDLVDGQGPYCWRSVTFPSPGFTRTTLPPQYTMPAGGNPNDLYNCAFDVFGNPNAAACPGDFNSDGQVGGPDLTVLLAGWGSAAGDINGDGTTNGLDLTALLAAWGPCQ